MKGTRRAEFALVLSALFFAAHANVLDEVEAIEGEVVNDAPPPSPGDTDEIMLYLGQYYHETCHNFLKENYDSYFTPDAVFFIRGKKFRGLESLQQGVGDIKDVECKFKNHTVLDIEVGGDHAVVSVEYNADNNVHGHIQGVMVHQLVKDANMWKTDTLFDFEHVDFSIDEYQPEDDETNLYEFIEGFSREACGSTWATEYKDFISVDVKVNLGGEKLLSGFIGIEESYSKVDKTGCKIDEIKVIDIEAADGFAAVLIGGHGAEGERKHPYLDVFGLSKNSEGKWMFDIIIMFVHVGIF